MANALRLDSEWKELLDLHNRHAPDLFEQGDEIRGTPYAESIRSALDELSLSAIFCVNGVPTIAIVRCEQYDLDETMIIHAALWNQGLASVLAIVTEDTARVFSLAKTPYVGDDEGFEKRCLIETLDATSSLLELQSLTTGAETGRFWRERKDYFKPSERIDAVLLGNLEHAHDLLIRENMESPQAQAILIQTMFVAYLEDRKIIGPDYFLNATGEEFSSWSNILNSKDEKNLRNLFERLQKDFNGDLFVAPCSFSRDADTVQLSSDSLDILGRFRLGCEEMSLNGAQLRFWGYNFQFIPVELISAVYDRFLGKDEKNRKNTGAYYTPMFLADSAIAATWTQLTDTQKENGTFLDPACGSGVFLVRSFQRLCQHWRETRNAKTIRWDSLQKMLLRIHGRDINSGAVRVAVFSLYLALLEQVSPPDLRKLISKKGLLPTLWGRTLILQDFFDEKSAECQHDVIVGNPPWTSRKGGDRAALKWAAANKYPVPQGEEAWAFTWKGFEHLKAGGVLSYLLPAMGFLHNHAEQSVNARSRLFRDARIRQVINFSDLRFQLFDGAIRPAALFVIQSKPSDLEHYEFAYWAPKADLNLAIKRFVTLSPSDKMVLRSQEVHEDALLFKHRLWMRSPESKLFAYLSRLPKIGERVHTSRGKNQSTKSWIIGQGYQPFNRDRTASTSRQSNKVGIYPNLDVKEFTPLSIHSDNMKPWSSNEVRRRGFENGFDGIRIIMPRGVQTSKWRLRAAFVENPLTFQDIIQAINVPPSDREDAQLLTALLNSKLALWFAFHGTASFGADRPEVKQAELLRLPFPSPPDLPDPNQAKEARRKLIEIVEEHSKSGNDILSAQNEETILLDRIDQLTYAYFGLTQNEIILIEDAAQFIIPSSQPSAGTFPAVWKISDHRDRGAYAKTMSDRLGKWLNTKDAVGISLVTKNLDFAILKLSISDNQKSDYWEDNEESFGEALSRLSNTVGQPVNENFILLPNIRLFVGSNLYLIKPLQKRFWLRSTALADADEIAFELESLDHVNRSKEIAS